MHSEIRAGSKLFLLMLLGILVTGFWACQHAGFSYRGGMTSKADRISIVDEGTQQGTWETPDLTLAYEYTRSRDDLDLRGRISFSRHLIYGYNTLERFTVQANFAGPEGKILDSVMLLVAGRNVDLEAMSFSRDFTLPPGSEYMVFSYRGRAKGSGGDQEGSVSWDFWKTPR